MTREMGRTRRSSGAMTAADLCGFGHGGSPPWNPSSSQLLSVVPPIGPSQTIHTSVCAAYTLTVTGPGAVRARSTGKNSVAIVLFGTTDQSQVTLTQTLTRPRLSAMPLQVKQINVRTGQLGSFQALATADLIGSVSPLSGKVGQLQFDALGPNARITVNGTLGQLAVNRDANLGPNGGVLVTGGLTNSLMIGGNLGLNGTSLEVLRRRRHIERRRQRQRLRGVSADPARCVDGRRQPDHRRRGLLGGPDRGARAGRTPRGRGQ